MKAIPRLLLPVVLWASLPGQPNGLLAQTQTQAQTPAAPEAATAPLDLAQVPTMLKEQEGDLTKKIEVARAAVDAEVAAKRISEATAQSLRWSLRMSAAGSMEESRKILSSATMPADNAALTTAFKDLEGSLNSAAAKRKELLDRTAKEVRRRVSETVLTATKPEQVQAVKTTIQNLRDALQPMTGLGVTEMLNSWNQFGNGLNIIQRYVASEAKGDSDSYNFIQSELRAFSTSGDLSFPTLLRERWERNNQGLTKVLDEKQTAIEAALAAGAPRAQTAKLIAEFSETVDRLQKARPDEYRNTSTQWAALRAAYASLQAVLEARDSAKGAEINEQVWSEARSAVQNVRGTHAVAMQNLLIKWTKDAAEAAVTARKDSVAEIRRRLATVKDAAALAELAADPIFNRPDTGRMREDQQEPMREIGATLSSLATAWHTASLAALQPERYGESRLSTSSLAKDIFDLRKRIERDVLSKSLNLPELQSPEMAALPAEAALERFCDSLAQKAEWRRLYDLLQARARLNGNPAAYRSDYPGRAEEDIIGALRSYFIGQNNELAEQWPEAISAYKVVLRCTSERAPVKEAVARIKAITKEHPEAVTPPKPAAVAPAVPFPLPPQPPAALEPRPASRPQ